jgi:Sulfatase-modifying factor enzyme 1/Carbohydrate binding module (family 6)
MNYRMKINSVLGSLVMLLGFAAPFSATAAEQVLVKGGMYMNNGVDVRVNSFVIAAYEITNEAYALFLNAKQIGADGIAKGKVLINTGAADLQLEFKNKIWSAKKGYHNFPVVMVSYYGAQEYCTWAGGALPTELQWRYAAGGGIQSKGYPFAGSDSYNKAGWYKYNSAQRLHATGEKLPNELGIYDMSGNVWEWCVANTVVTDSTFCVHMGGSWYAAEQPGRLDARYGNVPAHCSNSVGFRVVFPADTIIVNRDFIKKYTGKPWNGQPQIIPGKLQCEWYDLGGEGMAYHDKDSANNGSGNLNPANGTFLNEFRMNEGVDISYTKAREIDNSAYNKVMPLMEQLYAGWTVPGEWINYTVYVEKTGTYSIELMYTASGDGGIAFLLNGKSLTGQLDIASTRDERETIPWRQWHHWNKTGSLVTVRLKKGKHVLTLKTAVNGNMNYDYVEFKRVK